MIKFKTDRNYLLRYCYINIALFSLACLILLGFRDYSVPEFSALDTLWVVFSFLLCGAPSATMHNCAHGNIGPKWINDSIGEIIGAFMLYGFRGFRLGHVYHHHYPDHPDLDVHPPRGYGFLKFVLSPTEDTLKVVQAAYFKTFGTNPETEFNIRQQKIMFGISIVLKIVFWILLFGPKYFLLIYLPVYIFNIFVFAHINYATHIEMEDGHSEIIDLNHNFYYRTVNKLAFGGYFHKSHHLRPHKINPSKENISPDQVHISWKPKSGQIVVTTRPPLWSLQRYQ